MREHPALEYLREDGPGTPHLWCPGCGIGQIWNATTAAIAELGLDTDKVLWVGGSGCTGRMCTYWYKDSLHTLHGRAIAYATGVKLARPELNIIVHSGDGECMAIGANHLIQAARRNIDLTVISVNNFNYGMTGGQFSPTTPRDAKTATSPYGNIENPFEIADMIGAAGGTYVARWTTAHPVQLIRSFKRAIEHPGFSFVEVISQCPTQWGRRQKMPDPSEMVRYYRDNSVPVERAQQLSAEELNGKFIVGDLVTRERPEFVETVRSLGARVSGGERT